MSIFRKSDTPVRIRHEVTSLRWLAEAINEGGTLVVPVSAHGDTWLEEPRVSEIPPTRSAARDFGYSLARTHASGAPHLGAPPPSMEGDGFLGGFPLPLPTQPTIASWGQFYAQLRLRPTLVSPVFTPEERTLLEAFVDRVEEGIFDHDQPRLVLEAARTDTTRTVARTHGDLWNGNVLWTREGAVLIDPHAHGGHAEEDLAALALFGAPHLEEIYAAYNEASPLASGWRERIALHQAHMVFFHAHLFGRSYVSTALEIAHRYL